MTKVAAEREKVTWNSAQARPTGVIYIAPLNTRTYLWIKTASAGNLPPVDDELYVTDQTYDVQSGAAKPIVELWRVNYSERPAFSKQTGFGRANLPRGMNEIELLYADTAGPDAHFHVNIGGVAYCGTDTWCLNFAEAKTYGSGFVHNGMRASVPNMRRAVWNSTIDPPTKCTCDNALFRSDFTFDEMSDVQAAQERYKTAAPKQ